MKNKFLFAFMDVAERFAQLSHARRLQVGAIVVKDDRIISIGYNGMPSGWDNDCEDIISVDECDGQLFVTFLVGPVTSDVALAVQVNCGSITPLIN